MNNPKPDTSTRVSRGGSWLLTNPAVVRAAFRNSNTPSNRYSLVGFRCALRVRQPVGKVRL